MAEQNKKRNNIEKLTECSVLLALSVVLSFVEIWKMPMGGGITLLSMLPVCLVAVKYGISGALPTAFLYSVIQFAIGFASGNVFVYCTTAFTWIICLLFDYIVPFSVLGFSGIFKKKLGNIGIIIGIALMIGIRFICHYITGVVIWGQWAEGMSPYLYSLIYNGQYMLPECIFTCVAAGILIKIPQLKKLLNVN
ncbi:MAG: energy-coupled thiamine transporter ThiT [Clostridia bacterium]|nr:energy-coupled thiamine transporter ThiT [Clostridia bacterium]